LKKFSFDYFYFIQDVDERRNLQKEDSRRFSDKQLQQPQQNRTGLGAILENTELNNGHVAARKRSQIDAISRNDREFLGKDFLFSFTILQ
jgi:hypothetical protein